jgi:quaternary ammonium compound-resistance protein SugE
VAWLILIIAGVFEVVWASAMKQSHGFTRLWPSIVTIAAMLASVGLLSRALRMLPLGTAYMAWTGIGAIGAFTVGVLFLGESFSSVRVVAALLIMSGIVLMRLSSTA